MNKIDTAKQEYADWCRTLGINSLETFNCSLKEGRAVDIINISEARQERCYAEIADEIFRSRTETPIVMMSGPSSSGKTSTSRRIALQCGVLGLFPKVLELDNYFVNREDTPLDENGEKDYDSLGAMDIPFLNSQLTDLLEGREIDVPKFDFLSGRRVFTGEKMRLGAGDVLFMEGIHALNPALTPSVDQDSIFRIYISPLSNLIFGEDHKDWFADKRLLRRILRDNRTRGIDPEANILRWPSVVRGEIVNINPYRENARSIFNSSVLYDIPLLKYFAEPLLFAIRESSPAYEKAQGLLEFTSRFEALKPSEIAAVPPASIMREFIGGQML